MISGIKISPITFIGETDRGTTYEFENDRIGTQTLGIRKAGSVNGNHYHKGESERKNPEVFMLLSGQMEVYARNLENGEEMREIISAPIKLEIYPNVWHVITALSEIVFIEMNSIKEHAADTVYEMP